jgi:hypothetical protein
MEMGEAMGPVNWLAVVVAAIVATALVIFWHGPLFATGRSIRPRQMRAGSVAGTAVVMLIASAMLGHAFARIGAETLAAKPWLYFMQAGGIAIAFVIPPLLLSHAKSGRDLHYRLVDAGGWLAAYLTMGAIFWGFG